MTTYHDVVTYLRKHFKTNFFFQTPYITEHKIKKVKDKSSSSTFKIA